jgi:hypothetical protein
MRKEYKKIILKYCENNTVFVKYLYKSNNKFIKYGITNLEALIWLKSKNFHFGYNAINLATKFSSLEIIKFLHNEAKCEFEENTFDIAIERGDRQII